jgi:hypothetical protein
MKERKLLRFHAFSDDRRYRYTLWREWPTDIICPYADDFVQFIGLNPSTADETKDDPTLRKCIAFAKLWGYGAMCMTNLFAFRATDPRDMKAQLYPTGEHNLDHLLRVAKHAGLVVAAWGANGSHKSRDKATMQALAEIGVKPVCLRLTSKGAPEHPLYVPYSVEPAAFELQ